MNEQLRKILSRITELWGKWSMPQRLILVAIGVCVLIGIIALFRVSGSPSMVQLFNAPIRDEAALDRILFRIDEENIKVSVTANGIINVDDARTARRIKAILMSEGLVPEGIDPWDVFDRERWTITDFERKVNLQRAIRKQVEEHIKALDDVDDARVQLTFPEKALFRSEQNPVSASVTIFPKPNSDITTNRKRIEGIQKMLKFAVEGLQDENIVITDRNGNQLNDFEGMEGFDRLALIQKESKFISDYENTYRNQILASLQHIFSPERVRQINIKFDIDLSKKTIDTKEIFPITMKPQTPGLAYDDSVLLQSITASEETTEIKFQGTGYNPEGPAGVEGQTPPAFKDMSNLWGKVSENTRTHNAEWNQRNIQEDKSPQIGRRTVAVNIDGIWKWKYDEKGNPVIAADGSIEREYIPVSPEDLRAAELLVRDAIGFSALNGDSVTVQNIAYDRTKEFREEDAAYFRKQQLQTTILIFLSGLAVLLISFIIFRMVSREMERRRRLAEEERSRREQAIRESAIMNAEDEGGVDVSISVEERTRMELMESVMNIAKEHPEDCAQLIRTWLLEE